MSWFSDFLGIDIDLNKEAKKAKKVVNDVVDIDVAGAVTGTVNGIANMDVAGGVTNLVGSVVDIGKQAIEAVGAVAPGIANLDFDLLGNLKKSADQIGFQVGNAGKGIADGINGMVMGLTKHTTDQIELGLRTIGGATQVGTQRLGDWGHQAIQDTGQWVQTVVDNASGKTDKDKAAAQAQADRDKQTAEIAQEKKDELTSKGRTDAAASNKAGINQQGYTGGYNLGGSSVQNYNTSKDFLGL